MTISKFKISNKVLSVLLCLALLLSYVPLSSLTAFAADLQTNADGTYLLYTSDDLKAFADHVNSGNYDADAVLMDSITYEGTVSIGAADIARTDYDNGYTVSNIKGYSGVFDGNGYTITMPADMYLFGAIDGATVNNLTVSGGNKAIVAYMASGTMFLCNNRSTISGWAYCGGIVDIVGAESSTSTSDAVCVIRGCANYGNVNVNWNAGGIVGAARGKNVLIDCCANYGKFNLGTGRNVGGIAGKLTDGATVSYCFDSSTRSSVHSGDYGIAYLSNSTINNSFHVNGGTQIGATKVSGLTDDVLAALNQNPSGIKWSADGTLSDRWNVTFDANDGTGSMSPVSVEGEYTLPNSGFTAPDGKEFKGWEIDGTIYSENAKINVTSNITAKAIWVIPASIQLQSKDLYSSKATGYQLDEKITRYWKNGDSAEFTGTPDDYNAKIEWSVRNGKDVATITLKGANTVDTDNTNYGLTVLAANTFELDIIVEEDSVMDQFTIYACDVNISGKGKLTIADPKIDAQNIYVDGNLTMSGADIVAESLGKNAANVIFATGNLVIDNSKVEIKSGSDWTQSAYPDYNYAPLRSNGAMTITNDSDVTVTCIEGSTCHAVLAVGDMTIQDSAVTVVNNGTNRGISANKDLYIKGTANLTVNSNGIAIAVRSGKLNISGGTVKATSATTYAAIRADEIEISGGNVTATAADTYGIYAEAGDINISGNANVSASTNTSTAVYAIGNIGISDSAQVNASGKWAIWSKANNIVVSGGIVEASGTSYAIVSKPVLTSYDNAVIFAGTDKSGATFVNDIAGTNYHGSNYVRIQSGYIVTFDKNGGAGTMANKAVPNGEFTLPVCGFTAQNGYQFKGWATSANGPVISDTTITIEEDTILYAIWEKIPADAPTVEAGNNLTLTYKVYTDQQVSVSVTEKSGYTYSYQWYDGNGQPISGATNSTYTVPSDLTVNSYSYYCRVTAKRTDNELTNSADSAKITVTIERATQNAPSGIVGVAETVYGKQDGNIKGVSSTMEYRKDGESTYTAISGETVTDLAAGKYYVRLKGDSNHNPSPDTEVTIAAGRKLQIVAPQNPVGYTVTVNKTEMEYEGSYTLKVEIHEGYTATEDFKIIISNWECGQQPGVEETYMNAIADQIIEVQGVADITAPEAEISITTNKWTSFLKDITFGLFFKETQDITITAIDKGSGVDKIYYYISEDALTEDEVKALTADKWTEYDADNKPSIDPDKKCVVYVKATDKAQNVKFISSTGLVFDGTAPALVGIENGGIYYGDKIFKALDDNFLKIEVDGTDITDTTEGDDEYKIVADNAEHTVTVTDKVGNITEWKITVYKQYTVTFIVDGETLTTKTVNHKADAEMPEIPEKEGYTQTAPVWDKDGKEITEDTTITAVYTVNEYTVTFMDENGVYKTVTVKHGEKVTMPEAPAKDGYTVTWEKEIDTVTADVTVKAVYTKIPVTDTNSPQTGDNSNLWLWVVLLFISGGATITLTVYDRKKRAAQK